MRIAVMQPYFAPYLGYFRLISEVDLFVFFDNAQMTKRSWVTRNKFIPCPKKNFNFLEQESNSIVLSIPVKKISQSKLISDQDHALNAQIMSKTKRKLMSWYPKCSEAYKVFVDNFFEPYRETNSLLSVLERQIKLLSDFMSIDSPKYIRSSEILNRHCDEKQLTIDAQKYIIQICKELGAQEYINLPGGRGMYKQSVFNANQIKLSCLNFSEEVCKTPMMSALHYAAIDNNLCSKLMNDYWNVSNG